VKDAPEDISGCHDMKRDCLHISLVTSVVKSEGHYKLVLFVSSSLYKCNG
jgi:hypothetical protein